MKKIKITIDLLLLLLFDSAEITVEKINGEYTKIILEDYQTGDTYVLSMNILWELLYSHGYIELSYELSQPQKMSNDTILPRTQQTFGISEKGKKYIRFKYPNI